MIIKDIQGDFTRGLMALAENEEFAGVHPRKEVSAPARVSIGCFEAKTRVYTREKRHLHPRASRLGVLEQKRGCTPEKRGICTRARLDWVF